MGLSKFFLGLHYQNKEHPTQLPAFLCKYLEGGKPSLATRAECRRSGHLAPHRHSPRALSAAPPPRPQPAHSGWKSGPPLKSTSAYNLWRGSLQTSLRGSRTGVGRTLNPGTGVENTDTGKRRPREDRGRDRGEPSTSQGTPRAAGNTRSQERPREGTG